MNTSAFSGRTVDHQLEFRGLLDREIGGFGTFQYPIDEVRGTSAHIVEASAIRHETALLHVIPGPVDPGQPMLEGKLHQLHPMRVGEGTESSDDASRAVFFRAREGRVEVIGAFDLSEG